MTRDPDSDTFSPALLAALAGGDWHAPSVLVQHLEGDVAALERAMAALRDVGVPLEHCAARGYRLRDPLEPLCSRQIGEALSADTRSVLALMQVLPIVDSTNEILLRAPPLPAGRLGVCLAEAQRAGRGRRGRRWISPFASSLYLSMSAELSTDLHRLQGLPLAVGVVVAETLAAQGVPGLALKWPNDLLAAGSKLGGILVETGAAEGGVRVVIGVGINVTMPQEQAAEVQQAWTDLHRLCRGCPPGRNRLAAGLIDVLAALMTTFPERGFAPWRDRWQALDAYADREVVISSGDRQTVGIARGVDACGALLLETATGVHPLQGGELSLRPLA